MKIYIVLTTTEDYSEAKKIAEKIVAEKLAACVNIVSEVESIYRWEGDVERANEVLVLCKTIEKSLDRLVKKIEELHSYENPEVIATSIDEGVPSYLEWVEGNVE